MEKNVRKRDFSTSPLLLHFASIRLAEKLDFTQLSLHRKLTGRSKVAVDVMKYSCNPRARRRGKPPN